MLPSFEKKPSLKRDSQNWWDLNKTVSTASETETLSSERDRSKNPVKSRLQSRSIVRHDSLPTIIEPPDTVRLSGTTSVALSEECNQSLGSRNEKIRLCIKRWKKISVSRSNASTTSFHNHMEVS